MPTVPTYNRQVNQAPLPGVRGTPEVPQATFGLGGGVQSAINKFSNTALAVWEQEKKNADKLRVLEADKKMSDIEKELFYNPKTGAFNKKGKATLNLESDTMGLHTKQVNKLLEDLTEDQKVQLKPILFSRQKAYSKQLLQHEATETGKWDDALTEAHLKNLRDAAVAGYNDAGIVTTSINAGKDKIRENAERRYRKGPEANVLIKRKQDEHESKIHRDVIRRMINNDYVGQASGYHNKIKDRMEPDDILTVENNLKRGTLRIKTQEASDDIMAVAESPIQATNMAREINEPEVREATVKSVRRRWAEKSEDLRIQSELYEQEGFKHIDEFKTMPDQKILDGVSSAAKDRMEKRLMTVVSGSHTVTNEQTKYKLKLMASNPKGRNKFSKMNLFDYRNELSKQDFDEMVDIQAKIRNKNADVLTELDGFLGHSATVKNEVVQSGYEPDDEEMALLLGKVDNYIKKRKIETGKKDIPTQETRSFVRRMIMDGEVKWGLWDPDKKLFEVQPGEEFLFDIDDIPIAERRMIEEKLASKLKPATEDDIVRIYRDKITRDLKRGE